RANFASLSSLGLYVKLYDNSNNVLMAEDYEGNGVWDYLNSSYDSDSNGEPDSPVLTPNQTFLVRLQIIAPTGITGIEETQIYAYSINSNEYAFALDRTAIGNVLFYPQSIEGTGMPNSTVYYGVQLENLAFNDVFDFYGFSALGYTIYLYTDPNGDGNPSDGVLVAIDIGGNGIWETITSGYDSNSNGLPDFGTLFNGNTLNLIIGIQVPPGATPGVDVDFVEFNAIGENYENSAQVEITTQVRNRFELFPDYLLRDGTGKYSGDNRSVFFAHTLINSWSSDDYVTLSATSTRGWVRRFYTDPDGDGNPSDGTLITGPVFLSRNGGTLNFVMEVIIPDLLASNYPAQDTLVLTATSQNTPSYYVSVYDEVRVSYLGVYKDPNRTISGTIFARCKTIYSQGNDLSANQVNRYSLRYINPNSQIRRNQSVYSDGNGRANDEYTFTNNDVLGTWTIQLYDYSTLIDSITIILDPAQNDSIVNPVLTAKANYGLIGENLTISAYFYNSSEGADYLDTEYRYLVRNQSGTHYLNQDGNFYSYTGSQYTRITSPHTVFALNTSSETISIGDVHFLNKGAYQVKVEWWGSCGNLIAEKTIWFSVGADLSSFFDAGGNYPSDYFSLSQNIYLIGSNYIPSEFYVIAYYGADGSLISTQVVQATPAGGISSSIPASSLGTYGTYNAVVYLSSSPIPPIYTPLDPNMVSTDSFTLELDSDGDGKTNSIDLDDDNDGILDTVEGTGDTDGDGTPDCLDLDSDGDGVWDLIEGNDANHNGQNDNTFVQDLNNDGRIDTITDTNYNGVDDSYDSNPAAVQNTDGDSFPDFQDPDDDGDGIPTIEEDANNNGRPNDDDTDLDGIPNYLDPDSDNDGIPDAVEGRQDLADGGDGLGNYVDLDSDGDGIGDSIEGTGDRDGDGVPNYLDPDSDGDGIPDSVETTNDFDSDGIPNYLDFDSDADGLLDRVEGTSDADSDGAPNYLDPDYPLDTDGDGIPDATEGNSDSDGDGVPNYLDWDSDNDGIPDSFEGSTDLDGDGIPNYLDLDSDGDGAWDINEGNDSNFNGINDNANVTDTNNDGRIDTITDANGNGLDDSYETNPAVLQDRDQDGIPDIWDRDDDGDGIPTRVEDANGDGNPQNDDADGDGIPNYLDFNSDGDTRPDKMEGTYDSDSDGIPDYLDPDSSLDSDGDGISDYIENSYLLDDFDGDGTANYLDLDSDGDGIPDSVEGTGDADGDGMPNFLDLDSDGDGILDSIEGTNDRDGDGKPNYLDVDSDGDGISDGKEGTQDFDSDGTPNYLDPDSDSDGIPDSVEGIYDGDRDGNPDFLDPNSYPPPHLLRNDETTSLSSYDPSKIFIQAYPLDPALDPVGPNKIPQEGEGAKRSLNGSEDDDDFYKSYLPSTWIDPDATVLTDNSRPLVFYELTTPACTLYLTKEDGKIKVTYTCP
ncbi:MAG: thrombospondin type 3 repeat-containing protein, partial [Thermoanaerobaculia bacterium]